MKNAGLPCPCDWDIPCKDGDRCPVHADCPHGCGDAGYFYEFEADDLDVFHPAQDQAFWEARKVTCECQRLK